MTETNVRHPSKARKLKSFFQDEFDESDYDIGYTEHRVNYGLRAAQQEMEE